MVMRCYHDRWMDFPFDSSRHFDSGANHPSEIWATLMSGRNVGVAVNHLTEKGLEAMLEFTGPGMTFNKFFVDSGAFSEVSFGASGQELSKPITDEEWEKRLAKYDRLARAMGKQVYLVAPDCVAHQELTLERLRRYGARVLRWLADKANVIVVVQKGKIPMDLFASQVCQDLGLYGDEVIWGIPMKKDATSLEELCQFCESVQPAQIHLLGLGMGPRRESALAVVREASPATEVFSDAVRITALVGRTNGKNGGPRPLTAALDQFKAQGMSPADAKRWATQRVLMDENAAEVEDARKFGWYDEELEDGPKGQMGLFGEER